MEGIEASSVSSFSEVSSLSGIEPGTPTEQEQEENRKRMMIIGFVCLLLLLLFLLGIYYAFSSMGTADEESDGENTAEAHYASGPSPSSSKPPPTEKATDEAKSSTPAPPEPATTTRTPSTGYGYTVCTIGRTGYDATMIPTEENLCEIIIYTHVYVELNASGTISTTGDVPYRMFEKVARLQRSTNIRFGVSYSPLALPLQFTSYLEVNYSYVRNMEKQNKRNGFTVFGTMGLERKIMDLKHDPALIHWYQSLADFQQSVPEVILFLGVRLLDDGKLLGTQKSLATDLFQTVRDMKVNLVVFLTHNSFSMGNSSCTTMPVSSWSANALQKPGGPALEHMFKFLEFGLKGEKTIEVAMSSTLSFVGFEMKAPVRKPVQFGKECVRSELLPFHEYCFEKVANEQEDADTMTALGFDGTELFSFETPETIEKKASRQSVLL